MASPDWSPRTALETGRFIDNYVLPHLGRRKLRDITMPAIGSCYAALRDHGGKDGRHLSVGSVRRVHVVIRRALSQAKRWGWVTSNAAAEASPGKLIAPAISPPDLAGVARLIAMAEAEEPDFGVFLRLSASTGARRGELCALRWADVDLEAGSLRICQTKPGWAKAGSGYR
jgi:integrase